MIKLEHVNISVADPLATAQKLQRLFAWHIRWSGGALDNGFTVHVGEPENGASYIALYTSSEPQSNEQRSHHQIANLNHFAVTVDDLSEIQKRVIAEGLKPFNHSENPPGKRFYFHLDDGIEVEVVNY